jgi:tetratricopeptide (TPR) repeat protein
MRTSLILFIVFILAFSFAGCRTRQPDNSNANQAIVPTETPLPEFTDANEALTVGTKLFDDGKTELAIEAFQQAVKLNPDLAEAYFKMGVAYALVEAMAKNTAAPMTTEEEIQPEANTNGQKKEPRTNSEKAFTKAVAAYKKIVDQNPKDDVAWFNLGRAYNKLNEDEDAEKALKQAVKLKPDDTEYQTELGEILNKLAKYGEAAGALKKAIEIDPDNITAQERLEEAEAGLKRVDYVNPKKDDKKVPNSNSNSNTTSVPTTESTPGSTPPPPPSPAKDIKPVKPASTPNKPGPAAQPRPH